MQKHVKVIAAAGAVAAVAVPSASAYYPDYGRAPVPRTVVVRQYVTQPSGFNWSDAGVGAAVGLGVTLVVGGSTLVFVRRGGHEAVA
jgi:hypothetical protein